MQFGKKINKNLSKELVVIDSDHSFYSKTSVLKVIKEIGQKKNDFFLTPIRDMEVL